MHWIHFTDNIIYFRLFKEIDCNLFTIDVFNFCSDRKLHMRVEHIHTMLLFNCWGKQNNDVRFGVYVHNVILICSLTAKIHDTELQLRSTVVNSFNRLGNIAKRNIDRHGQVQITNKRIYHCQRHPVKFSNLWITFSDYKLLDVSVSYLK